jgi:hypothetical protein
MAEMPLPDASRCFRHTTIHKGAKEIRLVQIQPSADNESPIRLTIEHVSLGDYGGGRYQMYAQ